MWHIEKSLKKFLSLKSFADDMNVSQVRENVDLGGKFVPFSHLEISSLTVRFVRVHSHLEHIYFDWCECIVYEYPINIEELWGWVSVYCLYRCASQERETGQRLLPQSL